jgi:hypothetical protein
VDVEVVEHREDCGPATRGSWQSAMRLYASRRVCSFRANFGCLLAQWFV